MDKEKLIELIHKVKNNEIDENDFLQDILKLPYEDIKFAKVDHHRELRTGYPEVIYCAGKTTEQIISIIGVMSKHGSNIMGTRVENSVYEDIKKEYPEVVYHKSAKIITLVKHDIGKSKHKIAVVTGGTSDMPVAEEAAVTAEMLGCTVERYYDVGVAGIHRLFNSIEQIREASVVITVAGMEGALASVVGGLVDAPVVGVPTSVGYGANFQGLSALLTMLNSCASGVSTMNIDNGFGAGYFASSIIKQIEG